MNESVVLKNYIESLPDFQFVEIEIFDHMGAIIIDGILQAGLNYNYVVKPRIERVLNEFPELKTTTSFLTEIQKGNLENIANWQHHEKLDRIKAVTIFFKEEEIETAPELHAWLENKKNVVYFKSVRGIGDKTADYFKILSGRSSVAVDRHLFNFILSADVSITNNEYDRAKEIITNTAIFLEKPVELLDHSIWAYMTSNKQEYGATC
jgi:thermostable 8-oxoguanine DNA glycosylase